MNNVVVTINKSDVVIGAVHGDEWWTNPNFRETPIRAFDLSVKAISKAQELGAKFVKINNPTTTGFVFIADILKSGVHFTVGTERFIYCPTEWIKTEKWEQSCLPIM